MTARYVLRQSPTGEFVFTLRAHSGQLLLTSRNYTDKDSALRGIDSARHLARNDRNFEVLLAQNGEAHFVVKNARKEVIAQSERYPDSESLRKGTIAVKGNTRGARLEDQTGGA